MKRLFLVAGCFTTTIATAAMVTIFDDDNEVFEYTLRNQLTIEPDGDVQLFIVEDIDLGGGGGGGNNPPNAVNDNFNAVENTPITINPTLNDTDPDGDLNRDSITITVQPPNGNVVTLSGGQVRYTPDTDFFGTDQFTYRISDNNSNTDTAVVTMTVAEDTGGGGGGVNCATDHPPQGGFALKAVPSTFDHCNFNVGQFLNLRNTEYFALRMNMNSCGGSNSGSLLWVPQAAFGQPMRVTISQCPGVFDDSIPPIPGDNFAFLCSSPSLAESVVFWTISGQANKCRINPGQQVYMNIVYGDNANPPAGPIPTCDDPTCAFIMTATE